MYIDICYVCSDINALVDRSILAGEIVDAICVELLKNFSMGQLLRAYYYNTRAINTLRCSYT